MCVRGGQFAFININIQKVISIPEQIKQWCFDWVIDSENQKCVFCDMNKQSNLISKSILRIKIYLWLFANHSIHSGRTFTLESRNSRVQISSVLAK